MENSLAYLNYCRSRDAVCNMMAQGMAGIFAPSDYWQEELDGFDYLFEASPRLINKLREHCYHITGLHSYVYRHHHDHKKQPFVDKLAALKNIDKTGLWIPESPQLGGFGYNIDGELVNLDTLKFYESLIAMDKAGLITELKQAPSRPVVAEIGAGWGGFAYQIKKIVANMTYVIIDLPPTLIFSATYLSTLFPEAKIYIYSHDTVANALQNITSYDFVFLPHFVTQAYELPKLDLGINMVSFQEMTDAQVYGYMQWFWKQGCMNIYSHNRAKSPHNTQISSVDNILGHGYTLQRIEMLRVPYTVLRATQKITELPRNPKELLRIIVKKLLETKHALGKPSSTEYRHLVGRRKEILQGLSLQS